MFSLLCVVVVLYQLVTTSATLTGGPMSVSVLVEEDALFHCAGTGDTIVWKVDGLQENEASIIQRGISSVLVSSSGTVQSTLTVPATLVNNGTTVQCVIYPGSVISNNATLTILPSIGPVVNVRFTPIFSAVLWDPPATAGVLSGLSYIVIVMNNNTGQVIVSDTTINNIYPLPVLELCQYYTANVTAFSSQHHSDSVTTGQRTPGEYYHLEGVSNPVVVNLNTTHSAITFTINTHKQGIGIICPGQKLILQTYSEANSSDRTLTEVAITKPGDMQYTLHVKKSCYYESDIMIVADDKVVSDRITVLFSTYEIQDCDVSSDQHTSSILVECTFAINSTAPGIVVIQDDQSQYAINKTLQRLLQDSDKGSVNITGLPAGEYSVRVYDNSPATDSTSAAYQHYQLVLILVTSSRAMLSTIFSSRSFTPDLHVTSSVVLTSSIMASVVLTSEANIIAGVSVGVGIVFVVGFSTLFIIMIIFIKVFTRRRKTARLDIQTLYWGNDNAEDRYQELTIRQRKRDLNYDIQHDSTAPAVSLPAELEPVH